MSLDNRKNNSYGTEVFDVHRFAGKHPLLSQLIRENEVLFECGSEAPSPSKDYGHIQINFNQVK